MVEVPNRIAEQSDLLIRVSPSSITLCCDAHGK